MEKVEWVGVCVPVCCAWEQTVRMSISAPVWSMCVTLCLSDGQSKHPWVGAVCASLSRCSALQWVMWLLCSSPHCSLCTLSYLASFVCPPPPSFYLYPVVSPPLFLSHVCLQPSPLLSLHSSLIHRYLSPLICSLNGPVQADILQRDLAKPKGEVGRKWWVER